MKIVEINTVSYGSTGKIMIQIARCAESEGNTVYTSSRAWKKIDKPYENHMFIGSYYENIIHRLLGPILGTSCLFSVIGTMMFIRKLNKIKPDIIHLHNLHGWYINYHLLFKYIKKKNIPVIWTLHDCWSFTGHCPYFTKANCNKWMEGCHHCEQYKKYPATLFDNSKRMWKKKKDLFTGVNKMTIVTPSQWLADLVKKSYLNEYDIRVINNGIDLSVFKPVDSDIRKDYNIPRDKYLLLGVAFNWGERKGLDVFIELAKSLDKNKYQIVLVGTDAATESRLPENIIPIRKTKNQQELAKLYTAADLFVIPTREDNYPTVNMEAIACGTPVITFNTGGSPEMLDDKTGVVVDCDDVETMKREIVRICEEKPFDITDCLERAKTFDMNKRFKECVDLYYEKQDK